MEPHIQYVTTSDGVSIACWMHGEGQPLIMVHGSWTDHLPWDRVARSLAERFLVCTYDRRGHSQSEHPSGQGSVHEDVADLATLIEDRGLAPAHIIGNSFGASIALRLAAARPDLFQSICVHEPPLIGILAADPATAPILKATGEALGSVLELLGAGQTESGARRFVEAILGPDGWDEILTPADRETFINNAATFLDEAQDPDALVLDLASLARFSRPALITVGSASPPFFSPVVTRVSEAIPGARTHTFEGAGHIPHHTHPEKFVDVVSSFVESVG